MHVYSLPAGCLVKDDKFSIDFINFQVLINNFTFNPKVREYFQAIGAAIFMLKTENFLKGNVIFY